LRLRFAPSPTGYLHVGGARTALFNWLCARRYGGAFLLRVEDTDKARSTEESTRAIFDGLRWLGLDWDEPVVFQGANLAQHQRDAQRVLERNAGYRDFTAPDELERRRAEAKERGVPYRFERSSADLSADEVERRLNAGMPYAIRFRVPEGETGWNDLVHGPIAFPNRDIEDFVVLRSDGTPVYNFAVVSDDIAMRVTHVMRGDDHISNTPKQILLYRALGAALPEFAHLPMIHGTDGRKLSKRHGAAAVGDWQHVGILPDAMANFLALLGWSPGHDIEVMSREELIARFDITGLLKKPSVFDPKKLEWMNGQHILRTAPADLVEHIKPFLTRDDQTPAWLTHDDQPDHRVLEVIDLVKVRARTTVQLAEQVRVFFEAPAIESLPAPAEKLLRAPLAPRALHAIRDALTGDGTAWHSPADTHALLDPIPAGLGAKPGDVFQPLRAALTGSNVSPEINAVVYYVGREESVRRIDAALGRFGV
jgi:glutamyl-tRNA synthetase